MKDISSSIESLANHTWLSPFIEMVLTDQKYNDELIEEFLPKSRDLALNIIGNMHDSGSATYDNATKKSQLKSYNKLCSVKPDLIGVEGNSCDPWDVV